MAFEIPSVVKPVSASTSKTYNRYLNRIANLSGQDTINKILADPEKTNQTIKLLVQNIPDETKKRHEARVYYSAIFYVLYEHPYTKILHNPLRKGFHEYDPQQTTDGNEWKSIESIKK